MIKQLVVFFTIVVFFGLVLKPVEAVMSGLGYPPDSNASFTAQTAVVMITIIIYIWFKNRRESKEYERKIEKKLRTEREIREKLERENQAQAKK